jgi:signal transduction histidine kinase
LPEDLVERVFEPFVSLDGKGGFGLGLSLARALARAHSGEVSYEDDAFVVRLPIPDSVSSS